MTDRNLPEVAVTRQPTNNNSPKANPHSILPPSSDFSSASRSIQRERRRKKRESKRDGSNNISLRGREGERERRCINQSREDSISIELSKEERMARDKSNGAWSKREGSASGGAKETIIMANHQQKRDERPILVQGRYIIDKLVKVVI
eukprot:scaffold64143_cov68-Attheya_sp.AAC.6